VTFSYLAMPLSLPKGSTASLDVVVTHHRCENPVSVQVSVTMTRRALVETESAAGATYPTHQGGFAGVQVTDPTRTLRGVHVFFPEHLPRGVTSIKPYPEAPRVYHAALPIHEWADAPLATLALRFKADWAHPRSHDACYITLPNVDLKLGQKPINEPFKDVPFAQPKVIANEVVLQDAGRPKTSLLIDDTAPLPTDPIAQTWRCQAASLLDTTPTCAGYAAVGEVGARESAAERTFIYAALMGVSLALTAELVLRPITRRWEPDRD